MLQLLVLDLLQNISLTLVVGVLFLDFLTLLIGSFYTADVLTFCYGGKGHVNNFKFPVWLTCHMVLMSK